MLHPDVFPVNHIFWGLRRYLSSVWLIITEQNNITVTDWASPGCIYYSKECIETCRYHSESEAGHWSLTPADLVLENYHLYAEWQEGHFHHFTWYSSAGTLDLHFYL